MTPTKTVWGNAESLRNSAKLPLQAATRVAGENNRERAPAKYCPAKTGKKIRARHYAMTSAEERKERLTAFFGYRQARLQTDSLDCDAAEW
jgi:hypothetical protein